MERNTVKSRKEPKKEKKIYSLVLWHFYMFPDFEPDRLISFYML